MVTLKISFTDSDIKRPFYQTPGSAGLDLHAAVKETITIKPGERKLIPTGLRTEFPKEYCGLITPRSGLALKDGISIVNTPGLLDSDYRGEIGVILVNLGDKDFIVNRDDRIAQLIIMRCEHPEIQYVDDLSDTERGSGGFGSTGK